MRVRSVLAALSVVLLPLVSPPTASADPVETLTVTTFLGKNCPANSLCLFGNGNLSGGGIALRPGDSVAYLGDYHFNDQMSSWSNHTGQECTWFGDIFWAGPTRTMWDHHAQNLVASDNDTASSVMC
ncbi:peptidase inhibitor family I36 protein [Streptomyces clavuligerus]|uniref:peptidase inhibitor family I36 protein n=1 Tax=Streptomyces clavuligerus TaxID=1901 RepID=UPI00020D967F|nr:peptidase inhibitor family I36 protein [Streptomyces clavuligerus]MBY6306796.1 peptidase inhibitor family I36 protein [Streptomyces clavuligerus]QCS10602.1 hypothetical protein CRV15_34300 [Streptomyces clavuligerus]QPJ97361.1 hypothetical protein GE265_30175 [Streptomyces clavuligerus]WDN57311.1 peptidase inhibitor family I36 protein [Streptomyces clavuligerus]